jgi:hypothetical protein
VLSDSIWWTRQSRIKTERRLLNNAFHSQLILLWYSFYSVAISIYYLNSTPDATSNKYWLIYSILVLVVSVYINGFSFKERASLIKENYEGLKALETEAKAIEENKGELKDLTSRYEKSLNSCENHHSSDYLDALFSSYISAIDKSKIKPNPTKIQILNAIINRVKRFSMLSAFYFLPIAISLLLNIDFITRNCLK